jgi:hypothetical protein
MYPSKASKVGLEKELAKPEVFVATASVKHFLSYEWYNLKDPPPEGRANKVVTDPKE